METLFWIALVTVLYTYGGYGIVLFVLVAIKRLFSSTAVSTGSATPSLTLIVPAYNEADCIEEKIHNTLTLEYPRELLEIIFVTDGSDDGTPEIVSRYPEIRSLHKESRRGKIAAIEHAMQNVRTEIVVFTDANTHLNKKALLYIAGHYSNPKNGAVAGEKRIDINTVNDATASEGFYWRFESWLKRMESELYSVAGAAGELFSMRTDLYRSLPPDTILDDLLLSLEVPLKGYRVVYESRSCATEKGSLSIREETKRKIRIAAGGIQTIARRPELLLPLPNPVLWFEYMSHRVFRWIVAPYLLPLVFLSSGVLVYHERAGIFIKTVFITQCIFYLLAVAGYFVRNRQVALRILFIPCYFCMMNSNMIRGLFRYIFSNQPAAWDKARRR